MDNITDTTTFFIVGSIVLCFLIYKHNCNNYTEPLCLCSGAQLPGTELLRNKSDYQDKVKSCEYAKQFSAVL